MKNTNALNFILNLVHIISANDNIIKSCEIQIQTVLYNGASTKLTRKHSCDCALSKNQRTQHHFFQILSYTKKIFVEIHVSIIGCIVQINFSLKFHLRLMDGIVTNN